MRVVIAGGPLVGKSTLAKLLSDETGWDIFATDDLIDLGWSEASQAASDWFNMPGPFIVEGVAVPRAMRKWLAANLSEDVMPCDRFVYLRDPFGDRVRGQESMAKGCDTVFAEIEDELERRCVEVYGNVRHDGRYDFEDLVMDLAR